MDTVIESRVGVNRIFQGIDDSNLNDHNRIGQLSTMAAQRVEQIARIFASGVEYLFSLAHELIIKSGHQSETIKLRGKWVQLDPSQWKTSRDMRLVAPFAAGNTDALMQRLMVIANFQEKAFLSGLPIVDPQNAYNMAIELTKAANFSGVDKFWTDPSTVPPQPEKPSLEEVAQQIEREENISQEKIKLAELDQRETDSTRRAELDKYRADLQAEVQLILARIKAGEQVNLEGVKAKLRDAPILENNDNVKASIDGVQAIATAQADAIEKITQAVNSLQESSDSEKEIVRDDKGRVIGSRRKGNGANRQG